MFCVNCSKELPDEAKFCFSCGKKTDNKIIELDNKSNNKNRTIDFDDEIIEIKKESRTDLLFENIKIKNNIKKREKAPSIIDGKGDLAITTNIDCSIKTNNKTYKTKDKYIFINDLKYGKIEIKAETNDLFKTTDILLDKKLTKLSIKLKPKMANLYAKSQIGGFELKINKKKHKCPELIKNIPIGNYNVDIKYKNLRYKDKIILKDCIDYEYEFNEVKLKELHTNLELSILGTITKLPETNLKECNNKIKSYEKFTSTIKYIDFSKEEVIKKLNNKISELTVIAETKGLDRIKKLPENNVEECEKKLNEYIGFSCKLENIKIQKDKYIKAINEKLPIISQEELFSILNIPESSLDNKRKKIELLFDFQGSTEALEEKAEKEFDRLNAFMKEYKKELERNQKLRVKKRTLVLISIIAVIIILSVIISEIYSNIKIKAEDKLYNESVVENSITAYDKYLNKHGSKGRYYYFVKNKKKLIEEKIENNNYLRNYNTAFLKFKNKKYISALDYVFEAKKFKITKELNLLKQKIILAMPITRLRSSYKYMSENQVKTMMHTIFGKGWFKNYYESRIVSGDKVIIDYATKLMWHQSGSYSKENFYNSRLWVKNLNRRGYAGCNDWRFPTFEEILSLYEKKNINGLYIDDKFSAKQSDCWTGDRLDSNYYLFGHFSSGGWAMGKGTVISFVRPVRSLKIKVINMKK